LENKLLDRIAESFNTPFPEAESLEEYLDKILPMVGSNSEDLREEEFYTNKPWVEVQDNENFHELVFHFFSPRPNEDDLDREYIKTVDGRAQQGTYRYVGNKMFIGDDGYQNTNVYELAFMDEEFMILKLLANPKKFVTGNADKYFVLTVERLGRRLEWYDLMRHLFEKYQSNNLTYYLIAVFIAIIVIMLIS
jgi:hypothetical protein